MRYIVLALAALFLASCSASSSPRSTLGALQDAAIASRRAVRPVIDSYCEAIKIGCVGECDAYKTCSAARTIIINTFEAAQFAIADANIALALGQSERFEAATLKAQMLLTAVQQQMQMLGLIPGDDHGSD